MKVEARHTHPGYHNASGTRVPSVTTICKLIDKPEGLIHWAWKCGTEGKDYRNVRDEAATAGHVAHGMVEAAIKGSSFVLDPALDEQIVANAKRSFASFQSWMESTRFQLERTEVSLVSERHQFGGRLDCIALVMSEGKPERCIVDWKTSSGVYASYVVQVSAYRGAWNESNRNQPIIGCHLLRMKKDDAGFVHHYFPPETLDKAWRAFLVCRELYDLQSALGKLI